MAGKVDVLPRWVDPFKMADQRASLDGNVPFSCMQRLDDAGLRPGGDDARARLEFDRHPDGFGLVRIGVRARLLCVCQRCLGEMNLDIDRRSNLAIADTQAEDTGQKEGYETVAPVDGRLAVRLLVEDEILLAVPDIPMHEDTADCDNEVLALQVTPDAERQDGPRGNPFEVLRELRNRKD